MGRLLDLLMATGCFVLISTLWVSALGLLTTVLMRSLYAFDALSVSAWRGLQAGFLQGGTVPLGFFLYGAAALILAVAGEIAILWRLPAIAAAMPSPHLPRLHPPRLRLPRRAPRRTRPRSEPVMPSPTPPPAAPPPLPPPAPHKDSASDSAILARILALFEVWNEPPPAWMAEALRDEIVLLSPDAWPTLESLGSQGLDLLATLQEHGMLPESPAALRAIGEVETVLRAGIAAGLGTHEAAAPMPMLTLAASWLCEALENFLSAQADPKIPPERLGMAQSMLGEAMRGMTDTDWASLDQFPEKASRVRVLTDRLREDLRRPLVAGPPASSAIPIPTRMPAPTQAPLPANPGEAIIALLKQFGFIPDSGDPGAAPVLAQRDDLLLLLQSVDLRGRTWHLPEGLLGTWLQGDASHLPWPGRQLWQQMARRRLRQPDPRPLAGLLVLHGGQMEREEALAEIIAADRRRSGIGLAWLAGDAGALPSLQAELGALGERALQGRRRGQSADHSTAAP